LGSGCGADVRLYQPNKDETQWWNRRDAMVRCVVTTLFSSSQQQCTQNNNKDIELIENHPFSGVITLILLFDEDATALLWLWYWLAVACIFLNSG
jgi:hypothetical protein